MRTGDLKRRRPHEALTGRSFPAGSSIVARCPLRRPQTRAALGFQELEPQRRKVRTRGAETRPGDVRTQDTLGFPWGDKNNSSSTSPLRG